MSNKEDNWKIERGATGMILYHQCEPDRFGVGQGVQLEKGWRWICTLCREYAPEGYASAAELLGCRTFR